MFLLELSVKYLKWHLNSSYSKPINIMLFNTKTESRNGCGVHSADCSYKGTELYSQ